MPFGLKGAPAPFQKLMDSVIRGLDGRCAAYLDDLIIIQSLMGRALNTYPRSVQQTSGGRADGKPSKCHFRIQEYLYLGRVMGN